jgi:hypothetical protein
VQALTPHDHGEAVALHRAQIIGSLASRDLERGDLRDALTELSKQRFRAPRSHGSRTYSVATLERWYYAYKAKGLEALRPNGRGDKGRARDLSDAQRELLMDIRKCRWPSRSGGFGRVLERRWRGARRPRGCQRLARGERPFFSRRSLSRQESASMSRTWQCCANRSTRAPRHGASPKMEPHCL